MVILGFSFYLPHLQLDDDISTDYRDGVGEGEVWERGGFGEGKGGVEGKGEVEGDREDESVEGGGVV